MTKPKFLGLEYAPTSKPVLEQWKAEAAGTDDPSRLAGAKLKSLQTFENRARVNPLQGGHPIAHDRWPAAIKKDYGRELPNLFRFEIAERWRGYYTIVGEVGGARIFVLYLWPHEVYSKQSDYDKT